MPYVIPSIASSFVIKNDLKEEPGNELPGSVLGLFSLAAQAYGYYYLYKKGHPEILLLPVATNVVSGIYEWARSAKRRVAVRKSSSELENRIEGE